MKRIRLTDELRELLSTAIEASGLSDVDLSDVTGGISRQTYWRLRNRRTKNIERPTLLALCAALGVDPTGLVEPELPLGLDDEFVADAKDAFGEQLQMLDEDLREEAAVEAMLGMASVILRRGSEAPHRVYERIIAFRRARRGPPMAERT